MKIADHTFGFLETCERYKRCLCLVHSASRHVAVRKLGKCSFLGGARNISLSLSLKANKFMHQPFAQTTRASRLLLKKSRHQESRRRNALHRRERRVDDVVGAAAPHLRAAARTNPRLRFFSFPERESAILVSEDAGCFERRARFSFETERVTRSVSCFEKTLAPSSQKKRSPKSLSQDGASCFSAKRPGTSTRRPSLQSGPALSPLSQDQRSRKGARRVGTHQERTPHAHQWVQHARTLVKGVSSSKGSLPLESDRRSPDIRREQKKAPETKRPPLERERESVYTFFPFRAARA